MDLAGGGSAIKQVMREGKEQTEQMRRALIVGVNHTPAAHLRDVKMTQYE